MKKAIISLLLLAAGCSEATAPEARVQTGLVKDITQASRIISAAPVVEGFDFEGHHYIVAYSSTGCGIIHAANCPCKKEDQ